MEQLQESFNRQIAAAATAAKARSANAGSTFTVQSGVAGGAISSAIAVAEPVVEVDDYRLCPRCGNPSFRRSRRRWYERLTKRPRMARCRRCGHRFPYPYGSRDF